MAGGFYILKFAWAFCFEIYPQLLQIGLVTQSAISVHSLGTELLLLYTDHVYVGSMFNTHATISGFYTKNFIPSLLQMILSWSLC